LEHWIDVKYEMYKRTIVCASARLKCSFMHIYLNENALNLTSAALFK